MARLFAVLMTVFFMASPAMAQIPPGTLDPIDVDGVGECYNGVGPNGEGTICCESVADNGDAGIGYIQCTGDAASASGRCCADDHGACSFLDDEETDDVDESRGTGTSPTCIGGSPTGPEVDLGI